MTTRQHSFKRYRCCVCVLAVFAIASVLTHRTFAELAVLDDRSAGGVTYTFGADGAITMTFAEQKDNTVPVFTLGAVAADQGVPDSPFHGNYSAAGIESVSFRIQADAVPTTARVMLHGAASGRIWSRFFEISPTGDGWTGFTFAFSLNDGWRRNDTDLASKWAEDIADVGMIGIEIQQGGRSAQSYTIAGFVITDSEGSSGNAQLSPLEQALWERFNVTRLADLTDAQRSLTGADGMKEWERILAEHDAEFAQSIFQVQIVDVADDGVTIRWPAVRGSKYTVFRIDMGNLGAGFVEVDNGVNLATETTGFRFFKDTSTVKGASYAYRVLRKKLNEE